MIKAIGQILNFEFKRLLRRRNILVFFLMSIIIFSFVTVGIVGYKSFLREKEILKEAEGEKVKQYHLYSQYGGFGFRLLFVPSSLIIFFDDSISGVLVANVNAAEKLKIYQPKKGKYYNKSVGLMDFSGILFLVGCFFALVAGFTAIRKRDYLKFQAAFCGYKSLFPGLIIAWIILINMILGLLVILTLILGLINGISIKIIFFVFVLVASLVFFFFFLLGWNVGMIKEKFTAFIVLAFVYFGAVIFVPWTVEKVTQLLAANIESPFSFELTNIKIYTEVERRLFEKFGTFKTGDIPEKELIKQVEESLNNEFKEIFQREEEMRLNQLKNIKFNQKISSLFPTTFYLSLRKELSSVGDLNSMEFYSYCLEMKKKFLKFFVIKRLNTRKRGKVQNFIKGNENEFSAKSRLPYGSSIGVGLTFLYIIGLLFNASRLHHKRMKREIKGIDIDADFKEKSTVFVLCKNETIKEGIFNHYKNQSAICLEKINPDDFRMNGIKPADLLEHLSRVAGIDEKTAAENLNIMGVDIDTAENSHETILKIYAAVMAAADGQLIVINDFLKKESRQFETEVFRLLSHLEKAGRRIIYLSTEMYQPANGFDEQIRIDKYGVFPIDLDGLTLR
jgi:hypothetical protein